MITDKEIWDKINEVRTNVDGEVSDWAAFRQQQLFEWIKEQLTLTSVSNWVTLESNIPPEIRTEIIVMYNNGLKGVAYFDGDNRFYTLKDDRDITEVIYKWHKLP